MFLRDQHLVRRSQVRSHPPLRFEPEAPTQNQPAVPRQASTLHRLPPRTTLFDILVVSCAIWPLFLPQDCTYHEVLLFSYMFGTPAWDTSLGAFLCFQVALPQLHCFAALTEQRLGFLPFLSSTRRVVSVGAVTPCPVPVASDSASRSGRMTRA